MYVINLDAKQSKGTYCLSLFIDRNTVVSIDIFQIEYIPQEVLNKIKNKSITYNCVDFIVLLSRNTCM